MDSLALIFETGDMKYIVLYDRHTNVWLTFCYKALVRDLKGNGLF